MSRRTFAIGDVHGDLDALRTLAARLPPLSEDDTIVFLGDYIDRGPSSRQVVELVRRLDRDERCKVVCLRGNHEDAWLRAIDEGWPSFVLPPGNGCLAALRSYTGGAEPRSGEMPRGEELDLIARGGFFPSEHVEWMRSLPWYYEDEHAIYVHAGLAEKDGVFVHPRDVKTPMTMLWTRSERFFREYRGKRVVVGHTMTELLPPELSGDGARAERVEVDDVVAPDLDVVEHATAPEGVERDVQHVVGVVRALDDVELLVELRYQAHVARELEHRPDASVRDRPRALGKLEPGVARELRAIASRRLTALRGVECA